MGRRECKQLIVYSQIEKELGITPAGLYQMVINGWVFPLCLVDGELYFDRHQLKYVKARLAKVMYSARAYTDWG